jgi:hypothetical protein
MTKIYLFLAKNTFAKHLILIICLIISYLPLLMGKPTVNPDAHLIMAIFDKISGIREYFELLVTLKTYDIQPIRDLTLFFDWLIIKNYNYNSFIAQNLIYWFISCFFVEKLLRLIFSKVDEISIWILTVLFSVYPLFCATLSWGIARKHILAFMFIVISTYYFLRSLEETHRKSLHVAVFNIAFILSIFSQPITLLWPAWAALYLFIKRKNEFFSHQKYLTPSYLAFLITTILNAYYYKNSQTFKLYFEGKTDDPFNIPDKFLGLGHYLYQLVLPYWPSTSYELGHWSVWIGIIFGLTFYFIYRKLKLQGSWLVIWTAFTLFPLLIILTNPHILSDNYLLTPALGFFVLILTILFNFYPPNKKMILYVSLPLLGFWIFITHKESLYWLDRVTYAETRGFERRPNCSNAINLARKSFALGLNISDNVREYLQKYECFNINSKTPAVIASFVYLQTYILYYDNELGIKERILPLKKYAEFFWFSKMVLAALYLKLNNKNEAIKLIGEIVSDYDKINWEPYYEPIIANNIHPFCEQINYKDCLKITNLFNKKKNLPYF